MKDLKKLAKLEGIVTLVTAAILLFVVSYFFIYDMRAIGSYRDVSADGDASQQLAMGIGVAFVLVFMLIAMVVLCVPTAVLFILGGVQLGIHKKKGFSRVCTVLAIVFKIVALAPLVWQTLFLLEPMVGVFSKIVYVFSLGMTVTSVAWSIFALVQRKKIAAMPLKEVHSEEDSKPDEIVIYPENEMPQVEENEDEVVIYPDEK